MKKNEKVMRESERENKIKKYKENGVRKLREQLE